MPRNLANWTRSRARLKAEEMLQQWDRLDEPSKAAAKPTKKDLDKEEEVKPVHPFRRYLKDVTNVRIH
jgi:hypothetical protein